MPSTDRSFRKGRRISISSSTSCRWASAGPAQPGTPLSEPRSNSYRLSAICQTTTPRSLTSPGVRPGLHRFTVPTTSGRRASLGSRRGRRCRWGQLSEPLSHRPRQNGPHSYHWYALLPARSLAVYVGIALGKQFSGRLLYPSREVPLHLLDVGEVEEAHAGASERSRQGFHQDSWRKHDSGHGGVHPSRDGISRGRPEPLPEGPRSEEHTSELQSRQYLV